MSAVNDVPALLATENFVDRHVGSHASEIEDMLRVLGFDSLEAMVRATVPDAIRHHQALALPGALSERAAGQRLRELADHNQVFRTYIGMGYSNCVTPAVISRNILENPGWYTQYTPYQAEISQGRLEALLNFQTLIADLAGLPLANASLLDEGTAAAEAMHMCHALCTSDARAFFVAADCHPQTLAVLKGRAKGLGIELRVGELSELETKAQGLFGALVQYPTTDGRILDYEQLAARVHQAGALLCVAADPLALCLLRAPGEFGADVAIGSAQRFGVPLGFGGPHAAFLATREEYKRHLPGRIVGVSKDARGKRAYRLALQTREQHIRRDKATSNICTAQVLLAVIASMYAVYHGAEGLTQIARRVRGLTAMLRGGLSKLGFATGHGPRFDTLRVVVSREQSDAIIARGLARKINLRRYPDASLGVALDETTLLSDVEELLQVFGGRALPFAVADLTNLAAQEYPAPLARKSAFLTHEVFRCHRVEHELLRYMQRLQHKDLSLTTSMIPLGSCTMKLNAAAEMYPLGFPGFSQLHPFVPAEQSQGYAQLFRDLECWLAEITGFHAVSLQPNAGSQGEYAGLLVIRAYHEKAGQAQRDVCLIPKSAHGTNPASAVVAGMRVVVVDCDANGSIAVEDLRKKAAEHAANLGALMITYPSTHGVFEENVKDICEIVHKHGGQVYLDGANMNAQVGLCRPGDYGADVCHLNLHKTFCIPHGGGGPGMGPIGVAAHLAEFLPGHPVTGGGGATAIAPVSAAAYGSASILTISWMYIAMMGASGLTRASEVAILNANYMAKRLAPHYRVLFKGERGMVAHEFVIDARPFKASAGVEVEDIAKRLMDYGFHAPTMSWPVPGTLMIEPTESESRAELDRLCDALIAIREEITAIEQGRMSRADNPLKNAPHPADVLLASEWTHPYTREQAAYPAHWTRVHKFWPPVSRVDNTYGDRNLVCSCAALDEYEHGA
ncbi:MAG TPA: aminomethyl-transferring glycine dehydrogenase [Polyangiales bacterium]|nr:aminomethyl-transferring glycine dehydrogenase [Polyangiales bacterium]